MTLSILICSLWERAGDLARLLRVLDPQLTPDVELLIEVDNREKTTGAKRNILLEKAKGKYVVAVDDDDLVSETYVADILEAAKEDKDAIVFNGWITTNGGNKRRFKLSKDYPYTTKDNIYYRYPNHIVPIRATIAKGFKFPDKVYGEDYAWATKIHKSRLIKTETKIDKELYYYLYKSK
jgi:glycosyltransferase involved in cell wall biosynthesis